MYCGKCGTARPGTASFCPKCGTKFENVNVISPGESKIDEEVIKQDSQARFSSISLKKPDGSLNVGVIAGVVILLFLIVVIPNISKSSDSPSTNLNLSNQTSLSDNSNSSDTPVEGQECSNLDEIRILDSVTYQCIGHGVFYWKIIDSVDSSALNDSSGSPEENAIRKSLRSNCNSLPSGFSNLMFQQKGSTFNNYGEPLVIYGLGLLRLSVYDAGDHYRWGPYQEADILILDTWNCRYPADATK